MRHGTHSGYDRLASQTWRSRAACHGIDVAVFYPTVHGGRGNLAAYAHRQAVAICRTCPVAHECLWYALDHREEYGVWGGTTPHDRQALHRLRDRRQEAV